MAIQTSWEAEAMRLGWRYDLSRNAWVTNETSNPGSATVVYTARHAVEYTQQLRREAWELKKRKMPLWHWGQDAGGILESIPYG